MTEEKKVALVTGASRGIGRACAVELAKAGYDIAVNYAGNVEAANETVKMIEGVGRVAKAYQFDVSDKEACDIAIAKIFEDFGQIDALVNNAGITRDGLFMRLSKENWEDVINTNLNSVYFVTSPIVRLMMKARKGAIVNMTSVSGIYGNAGQTNYSAAKSALIGFTKSLAKEIGSRGIRVNAVAPGFIQTDMTKNLKMEGFEEHIPLRRLGVPEDVAKAVCFLIDGTSYITGQTLAVDGGLVF